MLFYFGIVKSCDACGGGGLPSNSSLGYLQTLNNPFIHLSYSQFQYTYGNSNNFDNIHMVQLNYTWKPKKQIQLSVIVPYKTVVRHVNDFNPSTYQGIGDASVNANFVLFDNRDSIFKRVKYFLMVGGSIKLPTGKYQMHDNQLLALPNHIQMGTGNYSFSPSIFYGLKTKSIGLNSLIRYTHYTTNENGYQNGGNSIIQVGIYRTLKRKNILVIPQIMLSTEKFSKNIEYNQELSNSGGTFSYCNFQLELFYKKTYLLIGYQNKIGQTINASTPNIGNKIQFGLGMLF